MSAPLGRTHTGRLVIALLLALGVSPHAMTPSFTPTGNMHVARAGHQATLLRDGRVLVTGGYDNSGSAIARAEIFSAATGMWSLAAGNIVARMDHAATRLQDGRVLVVGGASSLSSCTPNETAEIYDPATDRWSLTGDLPMTIGSGTMAVVLSDGRILVSGGRGCGGFFSNAALFSPSTNTWSATAPMGVPRAFHSAVLLADSRVLVMGGATTEGRVLAAAEIYDPASAAWTATNSPEGPRGISCGGYAQTFLSTVQGSLVLAAGGIAGHCTSGASPTVDVEIFDPTASRWLPTATLHVARALTTSTALPDGRVLVAGGYAWSGEIQSSAEFFDPADGGWHLIGKLRTARAEHTATRLANGAVLFAGGSDAEGRTATAEIYMPDIVYASAPLCAPREYGAPSGVATNSKGHVFLALSQDHAWRGDARGARTRLIEYAPRTDFPVPECWKPVRRIGEGLHRFVHAVRIDRHDNIWTVDTTARMITKFDPDGRVLLRFGRRPTPAGGVADTPAPGEASPDQSYLSGPTDVAWDQAGNIFVSDGGRNARVVKYDGNGRFITAVGSPGPAPGQMQMPHSIAVDARGNVYVADGGNGRIQVFDNGLKLRAAYDGIGRPWAVCITRGLHQYLYSASNPDMTDATKGEDTGFVYKMELDGTIVGRVGGTENAVGSMFGNRWTTAAFWTPHLMQCHDENEILSTTLYDWVHIIRMQP